MVMMRRRRLLLLSHKQKQQNDRELKYDDEQQLNLTNSMEVVLKRLEKNGTERAVVHLLSNKTNTKRMKESLSKIKSLS